MKHNRLLLLLVLLGLVLGAAPALASSVTLSQDLNPGGFGTRVDFDKFVWVCLCPRLCDVQCVTA